MIVAHLNTVFQKRNHDKAGRICSTYQTSSVCVIYIHEIKLNSVSYDNNLKNNIEYENNKNLSQ
jgi:hypothetical protein